MKTRLYIFLCLVLAFSSHRLYAETITLLHVHDTHSNLAPGGPRDETLAGTIGGIARAAHVIDSIRNLNPNTILLHGGDTFIGDLFFNKTLGAAELGLIEDLGFDAITLGNHEFDLGPDTLNDAFHNAFTGEVSPAVLSLNLYIGDSLNQPDICKFLKPFIIKQYGNIKIGIFGATTPAANYLSRPGPDSMQLEGLDVAIGTTAMTLKAMGCNAVIFLSHLGIDIDRMIAAGVPGIDVILSGHDHIYANEEIANTSGGTVYIFQSGSHYKHLGRIDLEFDNDGALADVDYDKIKLDKSVPEDPVIAGEVESLKTSIEMTYGRVFSMQIGWATGDFQEYQDSVFSIGFRDTPVGNFVADVLKEYTNADIAVEPGGSTAQELYAGPVVADDLFRMIGYGFDTTKGLGWNVVTLDIKGMALREGLRGILAQISSCDDFLIQVSGMKYKYQKINNIPQLREDGMFVGSDPIDLSKTYKVATNLYVADLLEDFGIPYENLQIDALTEYEVLLQAVKRDSIITPKVEGRVWNDTTVGVEDEIIDAGMFAVYPNPCRGTAQAILTLQQSGNYTVRLYSSAGVVLETMETGWLESGRQIININLGAFPDGIYMASVSDGVERYKAKIVLIR